MGARGRTEAAEAALARRWSAAACLMRMLTSSRRWADALLEMVMQLACCVRLDRLGGTQPVDAASIAPWPLGAVGPRRRRDVHSRTRLERGPSPRRVDHYCGDSTRWPSCSRSAGKHLEPCVLPNLSVFFTSTSLKTLQFTRFRRKYTSVREPLSTFR